MHKYSDKIKENNGRRTIMPSLLTTTYLKDITDDITNVSPLSEITMI